MSLHLVPAGQPHEPSIACPCKPVVKQVRHHGVMRPAIVHRDTHSNTTTAKMAG